jgi:hypothetical protein
MNDVRHYHADKNEREIVKDRVKEHVEPDGVWHHRRLAEHADEAGAEDVRGIEGMASGDVDYREPDRYHGGSDETGVNSLTNGIVPLSHQLLSGLVRYSGSYPARSVLPSNAPFANRMSTVAMLV